MHCIECGAEFDEMNESQPVCPGCGTEPGGRRDGAAEFALLEDAAAQLITEEDDVADLDVDEPFDPIRMPVDLREAGDDAEALLQATGLAIFDLPEGSRFFKLPTERLM